MGNLRNKANKFFAFNKTVAMTRPGRKENRSFCLSLNQVVSAVSREFGKSVDWLLTGDEKK